MRHEIVESPLLRSRWDVVGDLRMHARASTDAAPADAPAVVLIHGLGISGSYMVPTAERLASRVRVYVPDLPGFGLSDAPRRTLGIAETADVLGVWIETLGLERPAMVGNSVGCQVIIDLAAKRPALLDRIVLQGPTMTLGRRNWLWQFLRQQRNGAMESSPMLARIKARDYERAGGWRIFWTFESALRDRPEAKLPRVRVPALVVRGGRDPICTEAWAEQVARLLPMGRLLTVPGATHTMNFVAPDLLTEAIMPFLDESPRRNAPRHS